MEVHNLERFDSQLKTIEPDAQRAQQLIEGPLWVVSRDPKAGTRVRDTDVWYVLAKDVQKNRLLIIWYSFDLKNLFLLSVSLSEPDDDMP